jgi:hypothetical protein
VWSSQGRFCSDPSHRQYTTPSGSSHPTSSREEQPQKLENELKQLAGESIAEAWEHYHLFVADLPVAEMEDWDFTQGFYYGLSQEAKEHIDNLPRGTFFLLKTQEARALFEKITASESESEEYDAKENFCATKIDPLTHKFQGLGLNQTSASEEHRVE